MPQRKRQGFVERRSASLLAVTQRALRPLVKLLMQRGISYPALAEAVRVLYFRVARDEFPLEGGKETDSRISILTGIHRRDVKRLRELDAGRPSPAGRKTVSPPARTEISLSARVVALWTGTPAFLDRKGNPRRLERFERKGGELSFEALVREVNRDVRPRALLDEWLRRGAVSLDEDGLVCLNIEAFMSHKEVDEKAFYFAQNIHDHLAAITHNIAGEGPPFLERCVYYGQLTPESVAELADLARAQGMEALQVINRRALELKKRDAGSQDADRRMNFGIYFYSPEGRGPDSPQGGNDE